MTRDEYEQKIWSEYLMEARRFGHLSPKEDADRRTARHMYWADSKSDPKPWSPEFK